MELKSCPFCGGRATVERWDGRYFAYCTGCGIGQMDNLKPTVDEAVAQWDARPVTERLTAIETVLRGATHEVLFDPAGPKHVMAILIDEYRRIMEDK